MRSCRPRLYALLSFVVCKLHFLLLITIMNMVDLTTAFPTYSEPLYFSSKSAPQILVNETDIKPFECRTLFESYFVNALPELDVSWYQNATTIKSIKLQDASIPKLIKSSSKNAKLFNFNTFFTQICLDNFIEEKSDFQIKITSPYGRGIQSPPLIANSHDQNTTNGNGVSKFLKKKSGKKPIITVITRVRFAPVGSDARLVCRATGIPTPKITWTLYNEDTEINKPIEDIKYIEKLKNGDIIVKGDKKRLAAVLLNCEATNMFGSVYQPSTIFYVEN